MSSCQASGAKDIASFEVRLNDDRLPSLSSITHEGIFYEHYFDVGKEEEALFACDWSFASSKDPVSGTMEYYVGCGMRSKLDGEGIKKHGRPPVNLVIVLDISGSMSSPFRAGETKNKLDVAIDCVMTLIDNLRPTDSFGLVAFDTSVEVIQELRTMSRIDVAALKAQVVNLAPRGGTDMENGIRGGVKLFEGTNTAAQTHLNRVMFLTDARPNSGATNKNALLGICKRHANQDKIFTSFVGLGVDFGVELVDAISHIKGCNYFTVMSSPEFKKLMEQDFDYVVTPCCFDLEVKLADPSIQVERVYGSPGNEIPKNGLLLRMLSGFPSAHDETGATKGGMILAKIAKPASASGKRPLALAVTYADIQGKSYDSRNTLEVEFGSEEERYSNNAIRKAILLTRFVNGMKWWIVDHQTDGEPAKTVSETTGIPPPPVDESAAGRFQSLRVSDHYKAVLARLLNYYERAVEQLTDAGDVDDHLNEHAKQLVHLINFVAAADIKRVLPTLATDQEIEAGLTADTLQKRCEEALKVSADLSAQRSAFETEIKRRVKDILVAKLKAKGKDQLKRVLEGPQGTRNALVDEVVAFIKSRKDLSVDEWKNIANSELHKLVHGAPPPRRFFPM